MQRKQNPARYFFALAAIAATTLCANPAWSLSTGEYRLHNHPDGNAASPLYGLRLDGLLGDGIHTFNFDAADEGAAMFMSFDGEMLRIHGTAWGGLDGGSAYVSPQLWSIDMTYTTIVGIATDGIGDIGADSGVGIITAVNDPATTFNLVSYAGGHSNALFVGDEDGSGHRGFDGISGWGWLNYFVNGGDSSQHVASSDFLFTAQPVPLPAGLWLLASGFLSLVFIRRTAS